jgi:aldehyde dehydrogenase (NAD+)
VLTGPLSVFAVFVLNTYILYFQAFKTTWGLKCPGNIRGRLLNKLAELIEAHMDEFTALETLDVGEWSDTPDIARIHVNDSCYLGKPWHKANMRDVAVSIAIIRYYAGWADKIHGQTIEVSFL